MALKAGDLPTSSGGTRSASGYAPGTGVLPIQLGTPTADATAGAGNQQSAPVVMQLAASQSIAPTDGLKATYSGGINGLVPVASATDIFTITGSATKTVRVTRIEISGIATTILDTTVRLLLRTTADTGGTSTAPVGYAHDQNDAAATATLAAYTANPTVNDGTNRLLRTSKLLFNLSAPSAGSESGRLMWDAGDRPAKAFVLRGIAQQLAINLNGVSVAGGSVDISVEWTEE